MCPDALLSSPLEDGAWDASPATIFPTHIYDVYCQRYIHNCHFWRMRLRPSETQRLNDLGMAIETIGVNSVTLTTTVISLLDIRDLPSLDKIVLTGEALKPTIMRPWLKEEHMKWFNTYSSSEHSHISTSMGLLYVLKMPQLLNSHLELPLDDGPARFRSTQPLLAP